TDELAGPAIEVAFTASADLKVFASPPNLFEVLYLRDGIIVGGGPMLNMPGDESPQGVDLVGQRFLVGPGSPTTFYLGPRDALCTSVTLTQVWSAPGSYEVVVLLGPVTAAPAQPSSLTVGVPVVGQPLL